MSLKILSMTCGPKRRVSMFQKSGRPKEVGKRQPRPIDELFSESSGSSSTSDRTTARWYEAFEARVTASQLTRQSEWSSSSETESRLRRPGRSGVDPTHEEEIHRCPRSECRSVCRHCFAWYSRDAHDAGGSLVGRKHERVRKRMTFQCPKAGQRLVDALTGDHSTDSQSTSVSPVHSVFLSGRLVQLHLQAEQRKPASR